VAGPDWIAMGTRLTTCAGGTVAVADHVRVVRPSWRGGLTRDLRRAARARAGHRKAIGRAAHVRVLVQRHHPTSRHRCSSQWRAELQTGCRGLRCGIRLWSLPPRRAGPHRITSDRWQSRGLTCRHSLTETSRSVEVETFRGRAGDLGTRGDVNPCCRARRRRDGLGRYRER
jgi:hypothetical protein